MTKATRGFRLITMKTKTAREVDSSVDLRMKPCASCHTSPPNWKHQRSVFRFADCIKTRCNNCGKMEIILKFELRGCDEEFPAEYSATELEEAA